MGDAAHVVEHVIGKGLLEPLRNRAGRAGKFVALDLGDAKQAAVGGGDEHFVGGVEVRGPQSFFFHRNACCRSNFQQDAARDAFKASRGKRRREYSPAARTKDIGSRAFGYLTALVEKQCFVEAALLRALQSPYVEEPRGHFGSGQWRCGVAAMLAETQANRFAVGWKTGRAKNQVNFRQ